MADVNALFDDFALRRARGDRPDIDDYLGRAGGDADELADLIEGLLMCTASPEPSPESVVIVRAILDGRPPLQALRTAKGRRRDDVVGRIRQALGTPERLRERLRDRYHELESGLLDLRGVDGRVLDAVAAALGMRAADLPAWQPLQMADAHEAAPVWARSTEPVLELDVVMSLDAMAAPDPEASELDRLFGLS